MKNLTIIILSLSLLAGISCSTRGPLFEKYYKFENGNWDRFKKIVFNVPVKEANKSYDISLIVKLENKFDYNSLPVYVIMNSPSGEERMNEIRIQVKKDGKFIGEVPGQPIVIRTPLWKALQIAQSGACSISIENIVPKIQIAGIQEIGIIMEQYRKK